MYTSTGDVTVPHYGRERTGIRPVWSRKTSVLFADVLEYQKSKGLLLSTDLLSHIKKVITIFKPTRTNGMSRKRGPAYYYPVHAIRHAACIPFNIDAAGVYSLSETGLATVLGGRILS
jgi:hypothetical protein